VLDGLDTEVGILGGSQQFEVAIAVSHWKYC
jgi:hypothetical protein